MSKVWKVLAIIFMVLFTLETLLFGWIIKIGLEELDEEDRIIEDENICSVNICRSYDYYWYDVNTATCSCYNEGDEDYTYSEVILDRLK